MAIQEIETMMPYDLMNQKPAAAAVAVGNRLLVHKIVRHHGFTFFESQISLKTFKLICSKVILRSGLKKIYPQ